MFIAGVLGETALPGFEVGSLGRADRPRSADKKLGSSYIQSADQGWSALPVVGSKCSAQAFSERPPYLGLSFDV